MCRHVLVPQVRKLVVMVLARDALGGQADMPQPKIGAEEPFILSPFCQRHHGPGCGLGGAGGATKEMMLLPTL